MTLHGDASAPAAAESGGLPASAERPQDEAEAIVTEEWGEQPDPHGPPDLEAAYAEAEAREEARQAEMLTGSDG